MRDRPRAAGCTGRRSPADIQYPEHPTDPAEVLANISTAKDASAALDGYNPPHKLYKELKAKLAELRGQGDGPVIQITEGPALAYKAATKKQGEVAPEDPRVPQLRAKLNIAEHPDSTITTPRSLPPCANSRRASISSRPACSTTANGEGDQQPEARPPDRHRARQHGALALDPAPSRPPPRQRPRRAEHPGLLAGDVNNGATIWQTRVVVGKPGTPTPLLSETMKFITVNPTWNVPPSIVYNEYLPALQQDPTVLSAWALTSANRDGSVHISQPPGEANALGRVRFNFPTSSWSISTTPRTSICSRFPSAPTATAACACRTRTNTPTIMTGLGMPGSATCRQDQEHYGRTEIDLRFTNQIPVHITYQTAFVDDAGHLQIRDDLYGRDATMIGLLKNGRNRDLETLVSHAQPNYALPEGHFAGRRQLRQRQFLSLRTLVL